MTAVGDGTATGSIVGSANFMALRAQRVTRAQASELIGTGDITVSSTELHPWYVVAKPDSATAVGFRMLGAQQFYTDGGGRPGRQLLVSPGQSWARVTVGDGPPYKVEQSGPRRLWDEALTAYRWWQRAGEPAIADWRITIAPDEQRIELSSVATVQA